MKYSHAITAVWILCVIAAFTVINQYSTTAGVNSGLTRIPAGTAFEPQDKPRLLVFLHPKCTCSKATMMELQSLLPDLKGIDVTVLFRNVSADKEWLSGELYESALKTKGLTVAIDDNGDEAKRFGAHTSGHTVLISTDKSIVFSGGLTPMRGHPGETEGKAFLRQWNQSRKPASLITEIFGCNIFKELK